jgi:hypothetical protein
MKIKVFILTYDDGSALNLNLSTLYENMGNSEGHVVEVYVINNHSSFYIDPKFDKVVVLNDNLRPDWSCGHSTRSWNAAFLLGIKSLTSPDCDILVNIQDDMVWSPNWLEGLLRIHQKYSFYTCSWGDGFCSYTPEAVRRIGMWDERFCNIGYLEADYFLRALIYNKEGSSINDTGVGRVLNPIGMNGEPYDVPVAATEPSWSQNPAFVANRPNALTGSRRSIESLNYHGHSLRMFQEKWLEVPPEFWSEELKANPPPKPACPTYILYPYFECDIYDLPGKGYP